MIDLKSYAEKHDFAPVAVFGLGISGLSAVKALIAAGFPVTVYDDKKENRDKAQALGVVIEDLSQKDLTGFHFLVLAPGVSYQFEPHPVVKNAQKYNVEIIGDLELLHLSNHGKKTVGITGTNGKSTTTALMNHVLNEAGVKAQMAGNIGIPACDLNTDKLDIIVLEMSSYQLDLCPTFRPDISVLLNITPDHIDRHGSLLNYIEAKELILGGEGVGVIGVDDDYTQEAFNKAFFSGKRKMIPVSVKTEIKEGFFVKNSTIFQNAKDQNIEIFLLNGFSTLKGLHNYQNMACVYAVSQTLDLSKDTIEKAFHNFKGLEHRQYKVSQKDNVVFINDSKATNAEAAARALASYNNIYWIVGGKPKEGGLNGLEIFKENVTKAYLIGEASDEFLPWLKDNGFDVEKCRILESAIQSAYNDAQGGGDTATVLLSPACASFDQYTSFEKRGDAFAKKVKELTGVS